MCNDKLKKLKENQRKAAEQTKFNMYVANVAKRLRELNNPNDIDRKRWVWELIQNAKDTISKANNRNGVNIRIVVGKEANGDIVQFIHDGEPFTAKAREALLWKCSDDKTDQESTGRFGTGFLTTHCLSKIVTIQSDMFTDDEARTDSGGFRVTMYRDGQIEEELLEGIHKMEDSEEIFEEPFGQTTFTYHVKTESGRKAIKLGIENFHENIAQTMLFCKELLSVELDDNGKLTTIKRLPVEQMTEDISLAKFEINVDGQTYTRQFLITSHSEHSDELTQRYKSDRSMRQDAAIEVDEEKNIVGHEGKTSFFCVLPLVGIESQLNEPLILNSPDFEPDSERQSLLLNGNEWNEESNVITEAGINRIIYSKFFPMYKKLVAYLSENKYGRLYLLANGLKKAMEHKELDKKWYKENVIIKYREILSQYAVVKPYVGEEYQKPTDSIIIKEEKDEEELFGLASNLYPERLAAENHEWAIRLWKDGNQIWSTDDFCQNIEEKGNWQTIELTGDVAHDDWYNQFLAYVQQHDERLLKEHALLPDMNGDLQKKDKEGFKQGENVTSFIVELLRKLGKDVKPLLLHERITAVKLEAKYNSRSYSADVNKLAGGITNGRIIDGDISCLLPLLRTVPSDNERYEQRFIDKRKGFLDIAIALYSLQDVSPDEDNNLREDAWKALDEWFVQTVLYTLEKKGSLENLPEGLDAPWLNSALKTLDIDPARLNIHPVLPNQKGIFCKQKELFVDADIPEELKDEVFEQIDLDYKSILLHKGIDSEAFAINQKKGISDFASELNDRISPKTSSYGNYFYGQCHRYGQEAIEQVSLYMLSLLPREENEESGKSQHLLHDAAREILDEGMLPNVSYLDYDKKDLWKDSDFVVTNMLAQAIKGKENMETLCTSIGNGGEVYAIEVLNKFYDFLLTSGFKYNAYTIFPNQNGTFCTLDDLYKEEGNIPEIIKDVISHLASVASETEDYRAILADKRCHIQPSRTRNSPDAFKLIDDKVSELYEIPAKWKEDDYIEAVHLLLEEWEKDGPQQFDANNFPKTFPIKDSIMMNVIWNKEKRQLFMDVAKVLSDEQIEDIIKNSDAYINAKKKNDEWEKKVKEQEAKIKEQQDEIDSLKKKLGIAPKPTTKEKPEEEDATDKENVDNTTTDNNPVNTHQVRQKIKIGATLPSGQHYDNITCGRQYSGLSLEEIVAYVTEAKMAVVRYFMDLEERTHAGYRFNKKSIMADSYSQLYGVIGPDGKEIPLVVHSYLGPEYRDFDLNWYDYQLLNEKGSMLWVLTKSGLKCIPEYALPLREVSISFDSKEQRGKAIARTLAYVAEKSEVGVSYYLGNYMPTVGFDKPCPFYDRPKELADSIDNIKQACDRNVSRVEKFYIKGDNIPLIDYGLVQVFEDDTRYSDTLETRKEESPIETFDLDKQIPDELIAADDAELIL